MGTGKPGNGKPVASPAVWLGFALEQGIKLSLTGAAQLLPHVTPELIASQLPKELTTQLLTKALATGKLTPEAILEVAPPAVLAQHLDPGALWRCIADIAKSTKIDQKGRQASEPGRRWLAEVLRKALDLGLTDAHDIVRFLPPAEWVRDAPLGVIAEMIRAGLGKGTFNPELALNFLTPRVIAENLQPALVWACLVETISKELEGAPQPDEADSPFDDVGQFNGEPIEIVDDSPAAAPPPPKR